MGGFEKVALKKAADYAALEFRKTMKALGVALRLAVLRVLRLAALRVLRLAALRVLRFSGIALGRIPPHDHTVLRPENILRDLVQINGQVRRVAGQIDPRFTVRLRVPSSPEQKAGIFVAEFSVNGFIVSSVRFF